MILQLDEFKKQKVYELAQKIETGSVCPQMLVLLTEKMKLIVNAQSINEVEEIFNRDIGLDWDAEVRLNIDKANSLATIHNEKPYTSEEQKNVGYKALYELFINGLNWLCAMRVWHCMNHNLTFTKNYLKVLNACYKKDGYCPCKIPHLDTYCPCNENLDEIEKDGHCHCNMFSK